MKNPWEARGKHEVANKIWQSIAEELIRLRVLPAVSGEQCRDKLTKLIQKTISNRDAEQSRTGAGEELPRIAPTDEAQDNLNVCAEVSRTFLPS